MENWKTLWKERLEDLSYFGIKKSVKGEESAIEWWQHKKKWVLNLLYQSKQPTIKMAGASKNKGETAYLYQRQQQTTSEEWSWPSKRRMSLFLSLRTWENASLIAKVANPSANFLLRYTRGNTHEGQKKHSTSHQHPQRRNLHGFLYGSSPFCDQTKASKHIVNMALGVHAV